MPLLAICCTDKGQHPWTALGDLTLDERSGNPVWTEQGISGIPVANTSAVYGEVGERRKGECVVVDDEHGWRVELRCPRCNRDVQWQRERAVEILKRFGAAGMAQLDLSTVP